ncbi:MAG: 30S ribosomal protein S20 [Patescibacteria group bacterium]|nr:30S ribosomal protein S20 [Patescibacteria group bacterium]
MPIIKSVKKRLRQNVKRKKNNRIYKKKTKDIIKNVKSLIAENKIEQANNLLSQLYKALDKSAKTNVIKKNTASRKKSRITKMINAKSKPTNTEK